MPDDLREVVARPVANALNGILWPETEKMCVRIADAVLAAIREEHVIVKRPAAEFTRGLHAARAAEIVRAHLRDWKYRPSLVGTITAALDEARRTALEEAVAICTAYADRKGSAVDMPGPAADEARTARWLARRIMGEVTDE